MKISVKDGKDCEKILRIEVAAEAVQQEFEIFYRQISPQAKIPGFRPGKAPRQVIEMHYKGEAREAVLKNLLNDSYRKAIEEQSLEPMGYPEIRDVQFNGAQLTYQALVEVRPKIKLSRYKGLSAEKEKANITDKEIEESLAQVRESLAQFKAVESRPAAMGDFVVADYVCTVDGKEMEKRSEDWFELKTDEYLKGFSPQLEGALPGETREIRVTFPENSGRPELAGKEALFQVRVKEIKEKMLPEVNDDLAREAGEGATLAELKQRIRDGLQARKEHLAEARFEKALLDELVRHNKIDLPARLVDKRSERLAEEMREKMLQQGMSEAEIDKRREKMKEDLLPEARRQIHLAFLLEEIAAKENVTVTDEDFKGKVAEIAKRFRGAPEEVEQYYAGNEDAREALREQIRSEKAIAVVKQNAQVKIKSS